MAVEPVVGESDDSPKAVYDEESGGMPEGNGDESQEDSKATGKDEEATEVGVV